VQATFNFARIQSAVVDGCRDAAKILNDEIYQAIDDPIYDWPVGESPRDIVNTRDLQNSQRYEEIGYEEYEWSWDVPYAIPVFMGYVTRSGSSMPARNPVKVALSRIDFGSTIVERVRARL
jgi:hypothetical protein